MYCINLAQERDSWWAVMEKVMDVRYQIADKSLTS